MGSLAPTVESAVAISPAVMVIFIVFGGLYVVNTPSYLRWVSKVQLAFRDPLLFSSLLFSSLLFSSILFSSLLYSTLNHAVLITLIKSYSHITSNVLFYAGLISILILIFLC